MHIDDWLRQATDQLKKAGISSPRLDAEILLANSLERDRTYLHAHGEHLLTQQQQAVADALLQRRHQRLPIAYILGRKEFYGREFTVTPYVLIPRPETEMLIEIVENLRLADDVRLADVGTGSGTIAITLKLNQPSRQIFATDISAGALAVAQNNAWRLGADVSFLQGSLTRPLQSPMNMIVANLPYVDRTWKRSPETDFEPELALFAEGQGLALIHELIIQAPAHLTDHGCLLLEADPEQHAKIISFAQQHGLRHMYTEGYAVLLQHSF